MSFPDEWLHRTVRDKEAFVANPEALEAGYSGPGSGQLLVNAEWNAERQPIIPIWRKHVARLSGMIGAKNIGSAPWYMGGAMGLEAEIVLPKREQQRFWTGILGRGFIVLKFAVVHPLDERHWFEPIVTDIIKSLRFLPHVEGIGVTEESFPIPPAYTPCDPRTIITDIGGEEDWRAYTGASPVGALQAFYLREAPAHGWQVETIYPFPTQEGFNFARFHLNQDNIQAVLGIMPVGKKRVNAASRGNIVIKFLR